MRPIIPNLWFDANAEEAAAFYTSLFDDGRIVGVQHYGPDTPGREGEVMFVEWEMLGGRYGGINGGDQFRFSEAFSFEVRCDTQEEIDRLWSALADGGQPGPCGWIKDRFGFSWQITPQLLSDYAAAGDDAAMQRAVQYFLRLDGVPFSIADLTAAYEGG